MGRRGLGDYSTPVANKTPQDVPEQEIRVDEQPTATSEEVSVLTFGVVDCDFLNLRKGPDTTYDVVLQVSAGTRLVGQYVSDHWAYVQTTSGNIQTGYAMRQYLREV